MKIFLENFAVFTENSTLKPEAQFWSLSWGVVH